MALVTTSLLLLVAIKLVETNVVRLLEFSKKETKAEFVETGSPGHKLSSVRASFSLERLLGPPQIRPQPPLHPTTPDQVDSSSPERPATWAGVVANLAVHLLDFLLRGAVHLLQLRAHVL